MSRQHLKTSLESVAHQQDTRLFRALVPAFQFLRDTDHTFSDKRSKDKKPIEESNVEKILFDYTGINIKLRIGYDIGINAFVIPPDLDKNNPLMDDVRRTFVGESKDAKKSIRKAKDSVKGSINLKEGKVDGVFSEIKSDIYMAAQIVKEGSFEVEEAVAIFLHEVGHLMTYYEYTGRHIVLNHVMGDLTRAFNESDNITYRTEITKVATKELDMRDVDHNAIAHAKDGETAQTMIVSEYASEWVSATGTYLYDYRTWEALADQFVSRMGAARHQATALDKLFRLSGTGPYETNIQFLIRQAFGVLFMILFAPFVILLLLLGTPIQIYDPPIQRIERLRQDTIDAMKAPKIDKEYRKRLQKDVDAMSELVDKGKDRSSVLLFLWTTVVPEVRKQTKRQELMQDLEKAANNELYVKANELKILE